MKSSVSGVVVCVNYADYLALTLPYTIPFFERVLVVTDTKDTATEHVCTKFKDVDCLKTDVFYANGAPFAKSAGLNQGLRHLAPAGWVAVFDADIVMSPKLDTILADVDKLLSERIYGPLVKYHVQRHEEGSNLHGNGTACAGFFQLFDWRYVARNGLELKVSGDCSFDDIEFSQQFRGVSYLNLIAYHLGPSMPDGVPNVNWKGRKSPPCPFTSADVHELLLREVSASQ